MRSWSVGAMYWSSPSMDRGSRRAAELKSSSGMAVTTPDDARIRACPSPSVSNVPWPTALIQTR